MTPDVMSHAFEPYFTTKEVGKGTGLGLTTIHGFIQQSGGHIYLESQPGRGTTVRILLPRAAGELLASAGRSSRLDPDAGAGQRILVVEDNRDVRSVTLERLKRLNYRVIEADSANTALRIIERGEPVDLVFSDVVMPGACQVSTLSIDCAPSTRTCGPCSSQASRITSSERLKAIRTRRSL